MFHWTEDDPAATNLNILDLEDAAGCPRRGRDRPPHGDPLAELRRRRTPRGRSPGRVAGTLPKRVGYDGRLPVTWTFGDRRWDGFLASGEVPTIIVARGRPALDREQPDGRGRRSQAVGDSGYDIAARARQIRDDLDALVRARAGRSRRTTCWASSWTTARVLLEGWHALLLATLRPGGRGAEAVARAALLEAARKWEGRAAVGSTSYRIVRAFRLAVAHRVFDPIFAPCVEPYPDFAWTRLNYEQPLESILKARPAHLLDPSYHAWDELLVAAADDVSGCPREGRGEPEEATWGRRNTARIVHPLAGRLPALGGLVVRDARRPAPRGRPHAPRPGRLVRRQRAVRRLAGPRGGGDLPHAGRAESRTRSRRTSGAGHEAWVRGRPHAVPSRGPPSTRSSSSPEAGPPRMN